MSNSVYPVLEGSLIDTERTALYSTIVQRESCGKELRVNQQTAARYRYRIQYDFLREQAYIDEAQTLMAFFAAHRGSWDSFFYSDPFHSSVGTQVFGTGDGSTVDFYLVDDMGERIGGVNGTATIYKAGVLQTVTTDYSIDVNNGHVLFTSAPAAGASLTWAGTHYRRVRFSADGLQIQRRVYKVWRGEVELVSVLP